MSRPRSTNPRTQYVLTQRELKKIKVEISNRTLILVTAWMMDDLDYDEDKIIEAWDALSRWADAIDHQKIIKLETVCDIISEHTGLKLRWKNDAGHKV